MKLLYFTATGNCLYIAKRLGGELISIPQAVRAGNYEFTDDKIGLVFPIFWLTVPLNVEEFLRKAKLNSNYVFAVLTYGMLDGIAAKNLAKIGEECSIRFSYINTIKMVDNYLPGFAMEKQMEAEPQKQIEQHLNAIIADVNNSREMAPKASVFGKIMAGMMEKNVSIGGGVAKDYVVEDACNHCGTCETVCPLNNVKVQDSKPVFGNRCVSCLACTQNCPQNAIRVKNEKSRVRFRNAHISLKEIADANR